MNNNGFRFWMEPSGKIHKLNKTHEMWAKNYSPISHNEEGYENILDDMYKKGWIRLILLGDDDNLSLHYEYYYSQSPSFKLMKLIKDFAIELGAKNIFDDIKERYNTLDESIKKISSYNNDDKYWWMDPNLKFHKVNFQKHWNWASNYLHKNGQYPNNEKEVYSKMYELGFIRVTAVPYIPKILTYNYKKSFPPTSNKIKALKDWAIEHDCSFIRDDTIGTMNDLLEESMFPKEFDRHKLNTCISAAALATTYLLKKEINNFEIVEGFVSFYSNQESADWLPHTWIEFNNGRIFDPTKNQWKILGVNPKNVEYKKIVKRFTPKQYERLCHIQGELQESPDISLHGKSVMAGDKLLKGSETLEVKNNIVILRNQDPGFFAVGMTWVYFMDSETSAMDMKNGKIPYLMVPRGTFFSGGSPITDIWKKKFQKPGTEHILGVLEGHSEESLIYVDMLTVRPGWQRNTIATKMMEVLKNHFPNAKLQTSAATDKGAKFLKSYKNKHKIDEIIKESFHGIYGWWMDKDYKFHSLGYQNHLNWARDYLQKTGGLKSDTSSIFVSDIDIYRKLFNLGFVRVVKGLNTLYYQCKHGSAATPKQLKALKDWAIEQHCVSITNDINGYETLVTEINEGEGEGYTDNMSDDEKDSLANFYFSIGQDDDTVENNYCWLYRSGILYVKKGGTHSMNFGVTDRDTCFRGWYDIEKNKLSVVFPPQEERKLSGKKPTEDDIPENLYRKLILQFGKRKPKFFVFEDVLKIETDKLIDEVIKESFSGIYGWWMDKNYKFYKVDYEGHWDWATEYLKNMGDYSNTDSYSKMYNLGFVRVVKGLNTLYYQYKTNNQLTSKQIKELKDWAIEHDCDSISDENTYHETLVNEIRLEPPIDNAIADTDTINETMTYKQLLDLTTPERKEKSVNVRVRSIPVSVENDLEQWNFRYKSSPTTTVTDKPFQGKITFLKEEINPSDNATDLECKVDCSCPDYKYKFAYNNMKQGAGDIGDDSLNKCINRSPQPAYNIGEGLCKHLASLRNYLQTKVTATKKNNLFEAMNDVANQGPFDIEYDD